MNLKSMIYLGAGCLGLFLVSCGKSPLPPPAPSGPAIKIQKVSAEDIKALRRAQFSTNYVDRVKVIQSTFQEVDDASLDTWLEGFRQEPEPAKTLLRWEVAVKAYTTFTEKKKLPLYGKQEVYKVLKMKTAGTPNKVIVQFEMAILSTEETTELIHRFEYFLEQTEGSR